MPSPIPLFDPQADNAPRILQLYQDLELYSEGAPPTNSLFVLGRTPDLSATATSLWRDHLLIIDPPVDVTERFRLQDDVAVLFTGAANRVGLPEVQTMAGGVAHIRVGEHYLDIYVQPHGTVIYLPATGVVVGGTYGSDVMPPCVVPGSDGSEELETLRLLARLLKRPHFQLYVPQVGELGKDKTAVMARLAADVAYLHGLRRVLPGLTQRGEPLETIERLTDSLLPAAWRAPAAEQQHENNVRALIG
jgi:hypothetical protein